MSALHRFLVEFDLDGSTLPRNAWPLLGRDAGPAEAEAPAEPELDVAALPEAEPAVDHVAVAVAAALEGAEAAHAAERAASDARHAADLDEARARWAANEGTVLAEALRQGCATLAEDLAEAAAAALEPLLGEAARVLAVEGLRAAVADLVRAGTGGRIAVAGPEDLLDALRSALPVAGLDPDAMDFTPSDAPEVSVTADNSTIETRLGAWAEALRGRLAGAGQEDRA